MSHTHKHRSDKHKIDKPKDKHRSSRKTEKAQIPLVEDVKPQTVGFTPGACIVSNSKNVQLDKSNNYTVTFDVGDVSGYNINVNSSGDSIEVLTPGAYNIAFYGTAISYSTVEAKLHYITKSKIDPTFSVIPLENDFNKIIINNTQTLLVFNEPDIIKISIIPNIDETLILHAGSKLIISRAS